MPAPNVFRSVFGRVVVVLLSTITVMSSAHAEEEWIPLHLESFVSSIGPGDVEGPPLSVSWCRIEGSAVNSGFCPTGRAWRLDPGDRLVARMSPEPDCGRVRVWIYAASLDASGAWMRLGPGGGCDPGDGHTVGIPAVGGTCLDLMVEHAVPADGTLEWMIVNPGPAVLLVDELFVEGEACGDAEAHGCCETGGPGCDDPGVRDCVCDVDPFCCEVAWDAFCIDSVGAMGCGDCGSDCRSGLSTDFGAVYLPGGACAAFPELFEGCEGSGPYLSISGGCADTDDAALRFGGGFPWSTIETACLDFTDASSARLRCVVSAGAGVPGPVFEARIGEDPPFELGRVPVSSSAACRDVEIDLSVLVGLDDVRIRIRSGSSIADATRLDDLIIELDPVHGPCETGGVLIDDPGIRECVCGVDDYCCTQTWDELCVTIATLLCGADCESIPTCGTDGSCASVHEGPGCEDAGCCTAVCGSDPYCCLVAWDQACVASAGVVCGGPDPDLDGDGSVGGSDLGLLLAGWGSIDPLLDLDGDGVVGGGDLGLLLAAWGGADP
ncbi:MAG: hypothetical protein CMJ34_14950 [Phycisphaerae bacterium]|nr:hypothetical protein [Phycisphaerae bacterium]